jgi:hypothetical protein
MVGGTRASPVIVTPRGLELRAACSLDRSSRRRGPACIERCDSPRAFIHDAGLIDAEIAADGSTGCDQKVGAHKEGCRRPTGAQPIARRRRGRGASTQAEADSISLPISRVGQERRADEWSSCPNRWPACEIRHRRCVEATRARPLICDLSAVYSAQRRDDRHFGGGGARPYQRGYGNRGNDSHNGDDHHQLDQSEARVLSPHRAPALDVESNATPCPYKLPRSV